MTSLKEMYTFPDYIKSSNLENFKDIYLKFAIENIKKDIVDFLLKRKSQEEYYNLENFYISYFNRNKKLYLEKINQIINELNKLGWNTKLAYGNTALYIYDNETILYIPENL
jgi:hypothetical protein